VISTRLCHCGSTLLYKDCCELFISNKQLPQTSEQLMRSRYTAYKLKRFEYLIATNSPENEIRTDNIQDFESNIDWLGLKIIKSHNIEQQNNNSIVEFVAFYANSDGDTLLKPDKYRQLHEKSYFKKIDNRWFYSSGEALAPIKISRNEPCFCNSGKKYKKCHAV